MFSKRVLFAAISFAVILSACGPAQIPIPTPQVLPTLSNSWAIKMAQSGGIMGMLKSIEIKSDGKVHIEDGRSKQSTDRELSADQLKQLTELVNSTKLQAPGKPEAVCADCFIYDLEITSNGQTFATQLNDISLPDSGFEPLVRFLSNLISIAVDI